MENRPQRKKRTGGKPILCLDFDGVLHWYRRGWQGQNVIDDEPVPGAVDFVTRAQEVFHVVVYSSRSSHTGGIEAMRAWMKRYGFPEVEFATEKPGAFVTIDDRALTFTGTWPDPQELRAFQPWTRQPDPESGDSDNTAPQEEQFMLKDLVTRSRTVRRFYQDVPVDMETLRELVDLARLAPSSANLQPMKFYLCNDPEKNAQIFNHLAWAGYLKEWPGPEEGERPSAYIVILGDTAIAKSFSCDHGIVAQTMMLGAAEKGLGGCIIGSVKRPELLQTLNLDMLGRYEVLLVLALGKPKEIVQVDTIGEEGSVRYWRDEQQVHHVPKRSLDDLILK